MKIKVKIEDTFENAWNIFESFMESKYYSKISKYIDLSINTKIYDLSNNKMVYCKKIIKNKNISNWVKLKFSNNKELILTSDHPLYLENKGRTFVKDINIDDSILYLNEIVKVKVIEFINDKISNSYDVETETDKFCLSGFNSGNCRTRVIGNVNGEELTDGRR